MKAKKTKFEFKQSSAVGTSYHKGVIIATASEISKVLGKPSDGDNYKTLFEWDRECNGLVFSVYDYCAFNIPYIKEMNYISLASRTRLEYHIGTKTEEETKKIVDVLKAE